MDVVSRFLLWMEAERRYSPLTLRNYRRDIEEFARWRGVTCATLDFENIARKDIQDWLYYLSDRRKLKASTVNRMLASLRTLWRWMLVHGHVSKDIMHGVRQYKTPRALPIFVPDTRMQDVVEELRSDLASEDIWRVRDALIILLIYTSGMRLAELVALNDEDIAADYRSVVVMGKGRKERVLPLLASLGKIIKKYFSLKYSQNICIAEKKALILSKKGERINCRAVQRVVDQKLKGVGVAGRTSPHVLRHTFATQLLNEGADLREIQELLGHSDLRATQIYTHLDIAKLRDAYHKAHPRERDDEDSGGTRDDSAHI